MTDPKIKEYIEVLEEFKSRQGGDTSPFGNAKEAGKIIDILLFLLRNERTN